MTATPTRVGIVGLGSIGATHARVLNEMSGQASLVAASGGTPEKLAELGWPDAQHCSPEAVIAHPEVDVVVVAGPSELHAEHALAALRADKGVVVEKPLSVDVATAEQIVALAEQRGLLAAVISQRRVEPQNIAIKELLDSGRLGRPVLGEAFVHWLRDDPYYAQAPWRTVMPGGGSLMNQGLHNVDLLQWLLGPVAEVTGQYGTLGHHMKAEDTSVATLRFDSGALGVVATSTATPPGEPARLSIYTDAGMLELAHTEITRWTFEDVARPEVISAAAAGSSDPAAIGLAGHLDQWRDILEANRTGRAPSISAADGLRTVRLLCGIYESAATGRRVEPGARR